MAHLPSFVKRAIDWFSLADYEAAKKEADTDVAMRFGRGNVTFQNGRVLDESALDRLSESGSAAAARMKDRAPA